MKFHFIANRSALLAAVSLLAAGSLSSCASMVVGAMSGEVDVVIPAASAVEPKTIASVLDDGSGFDSNWYDYDILDTYEAGLVLTGSEVKIEVPRSPWASAHSQPPKRTR